jgi:DNA-binding SARP family transcriptional activator/DNA-binding CsgD family transcriptional regulator
MTTGEAQGGDPVVEEAPVVRVWLLGGLRVQVGGREVAELGRLNRPATLLKMLALAPGHTVHREQVQELLWSDLGADAAANNLHGTIHRLRRLLEPGLGQGGDSYFLKLQSNVLRLRTSPALWIDVHAFELAVRNARVTLDPEKYEAALALYGGDLLPEDLYADWVAALRSTLHARFVGLLRQLASIYEQAGELASAIQMLDRLVSVEPENESAAADVRRLYARAAQDQHAQRPSGPREIDFAVDPPIVRRQERRAETDSPWVASRRRASASHARPMLTDRERHITELIARGLTNRAIAECLGVTTRTAETHVSHILRKLDIGSREQVRRALGRN